MDKEEKTLQVSGDAQENLPRCGEEQEDEGHHGCGDEHAEEHHGCKDEHVEERHGCGNEYAEEQHGCRDEHVEERHGCGNKHAEKHYECGDEHAEEHYRYGNEHADHHGCGHEHVHEAHHIHVHEHRDGEACECPSCTQKREKLYVTSQLQDNAVVVSAEYHTAADRERAGELLARYMEALAGEIDSRGGIIGHIKTSVEVQYVEMYSLTDKTVMKKASELPELTLYTAAIVFCVKEEELRCLVRDMFRGMDRQLHES